MFRTRPSHRQTGPSCLQPLPSPDWPILPTAHPIARLVHLAYSPSHRQTGPSCLQPILSPDWSILPTAPPIVRLAHLAYSPSYRQTGPSCLQLPLHSSRVWPKTRLALSVKIISSQCVPNAPLPSLDWPILPTAPPIVRLAHLAYSPSYRQTGPSCLQPLPSSDWPILPTAPPIARLAHLAYSSPSTVLASGHPICSATGIQQAEPLGPVLFAMAVDEVASSVIQKIHMVLGRRHLKRTS